MGGGGGAPEGADGGEAGGSGAPHNSALARDAPAAAGPVPMDAEGATSPVSAASLSASLSEGGEGGGGRAGATSGGAPGAVTATTTSAAATPLPGVDPAWAHLASATPDAVILLCVDGKPGADIGAPPPVTASICGRRARLGWEARPAGAFPARPLPACPAAAGRVALYGGGGNPVEEDELYSLETYPCVRVRLHEARLRAASDRVAVRSGEQGEEQKKKRARARARTTARPHRVCGSGRRF